MALVLWKYENPFVDLRSDPERHFVFCGRSITVVQNPDVVVTLFQNTGQRMWDGSYYLARWIEKQQVIRNDSRFHVFLI